MSPNDEKNSTSRIANRQAVKSMKLLAVATGEYSRAELNKDAALGLTTEAQKAIDADKAAMNNGEPSDPSQP